MKFGPIVAGRCKSKCGRVVIQKQVSQQTGRADEVCYAIHIDGRLRVTVDQFAYAKTRAAELAQQPAPPR